LKVTSPKTVKSILDKNGLVPLKNFGQNFLIDENIVTKIADAATHPPCSNLLEIGMGLGALTQKLAERAENVVTVEIDKGLLALENELFKGCQNIKVIAGDILDVDIGNLSERYFNGGDFCVCGNLPYYITSKILLHIFESGAPMTRIVFMVQKEVARRLAAQPGDTDYGSLTASLLYYARPELLFDVSKNCFYPAPDVDSSVISFSLRDKYSETDREAYTKIVRASFSMRRKTIFNNLKRIASPTDVSNALEAADVSPSSRAQDISPRQFAVIAKALND